MNLYHVEECKVTENWGWLKCGRRVAGMGNPELLSWAMLMVEAEVERTETRLLNQIADLQAENAKLKADCASYDKVLNDVAIGYLEATETIKALESNAIENALSQKAQNDFDAETEMRVQDILEAKESPALAETRIRVNWSGNGFSSGSYKRLATFVRSEKLWTVIEIDRANKISQLTLLSEKCEVVL